MIDTMGPWLLIATVLAGINLVFLGVLTLVWVRNYRTFGSAMTAGLAAFATVLLIENAVAISFFFSTGMLYAGSPGAQETIAILRALQTVALAFLTYVTVK